MPGKSYYSHTNKQSILQANYYLFSLLLNANTSYGLELNVCPMSCNSAVVYFSTRRSHNSGINSAPLRPFRIQR